jgi:Tfp pilus assembly protein PilF
MKRLGIGLTVMVLLAGCASPKSRTVALSDRAAGELRQGDLKAARKLLEEAQAISPNDPRVLLNLGVLAHKEGNFALARETYLNAINHAWSEKDARLRDEHGDARSIVEILKDNLTKLRADEERAIREKAGGTTE